ASFWYDLNESDTDGCEYFCQPTAESDLCDGVDLQDTDNPYQPLDNDCDEDFDEDVDFDNDPLNCGWCGHLCHFANAEPLCVGGECQAGECNTGYYDVDTDPGCEYECEFLQDEELCNGKDDNCDGQIDEGDPESGGACGGADPFGCDPEIYTDGECPDGAEQGDCTAGELHCVNGQLQCQGGTGPADQEECNGIDDDCDGLVDEEEDIPQVGPDGALCGSATGVCEQGRQRCAYPDASADSRELLCCESVDTEGVCVPPLMPGDQLEICDGLDNDCDGLIDEDPDNPDQKMTNGECWWPNIVEGSGVCQPGQLTCFGFGGSANWVCQGATGPEVEECNDVDDDCDGQTDEGIFESCGGCDPALYPEFSCPNGPTEGRCQQGTRTCSTTGSGWEPCLGGIGPIEELCNGIDDDCDGVTDEDVTAASDPQVGQPCPDKVGACAGTTVCESGEIVCDNDLQPGDQAETCNDVDDDCDGYTDEGLMEACGGADPSGCDPTVYTDGECPDGADQGLCQAGIQTCEDGQPSGCQGSIGPECGWDDGCDLCDGVDNDCDGVTDEDYSGGGTCGPCDNGTYICQNGIEQCSGGDVPSPEVCNGVDDNCDGSTDEGLYEICGGCDPAVYTQCTSDPSEGSCQTGVRYCDPDASSPGNPVYGACQGNTDPIPEICDGEDNDCDGQSDESGDLTAPDGTCDPDCPGINTEVCLGSSGWDCDYQCGTSAGDVECDAQGNPAPVETICDGYDNNCDGQTDESFDFNYDVNHCGGCNLDCETMGSLWDQGTVPAHVAIFGCQNGSCVIVQCEDTYWDDSTNAYSDCEIGPCTQSNDGVEECNGIDDDCDGQTDEDIGGTEICNDVDDDCDGQTDEDLSLPPSTCKSLGECDGIESVAACDGANEQWNCNYDALGSQVELSGGEPVAEETICDGLDNDCDGWTDEPFSTLGSACDNGGVGACYDSGIYLCNQSGDDVVCCDVGNSGTVCQSGNQIGTISGTDEVCNGIDDDCDGTTDEGAGVTDPASTTTYVDYITVSGSGWSYDIFAYEASRPDAADYNGSNWTEMGSKTTAACATADAVPWTMVDKTEAEQACWKLNASGTYEVGGWDLCTADQWQYACQYGGGSDPTPHEYPYGDTYGPTICNGHEYDGSWDHVVGSGYATSCISESSVWGESLDLFDLSGNVEEWTGTDRTVGSDTLWEIRGGSYNDLAGGMTCDFDFWAAEATFTMPNLGFRCCRGDDPEYPCQLDVHETFDTSTLPSGWANVSDWAWTDSNNSITGSSGGYWWIDSDNYIDFDEYLYTDTYTVGLCQAITFEFNHDYQYYSGDYGEVQIQVDGGAWQTLATYDYNSSGTQSLDITSYISGATDFRLRFHYVAYFDWYWKVDDVKVYGY
ncbi:MAG: MopE-related protein, partial [Polyangia bacterium]